MDYRRPPRPWAHGSHGRCLIFIVRCDKSLGTPAQGVGRTSEETAPMAAHLLKRIRPNVAILDNPIAIREWQMLRRRAGNWRIWVGLKWPLDPIVWGAPVILT